jgi:four helix bundle protein
MSEKENIIKTLSFEFALQSIDLYKKLSASKEFIISKQFLKSSTSIGANIEEAIAGFSKKDFVYKMSIALKEARETRYWLKLLDQSKLADIDFSKYHSDIEQIISILTSIVKTTQKNL